jgi:UDP-N-acetylmuramate--alanine ligase
MIGIKGQGMTALAELLFARGIILSGSDIEEEFTTDKVLRSLGIPFTEGFSAKNIPPDVELIIYSTAYNADNNEEVRSALESGEKVLTYPEAIGEISREKLTLAVCGTHGKTTTAAFLAEILKSIGEDPSAIVGSTIPDWKGNALIGSGDFLVLESDEYQDKLALYHPFAVILTSVDWDHPDYFPTKESYMEVFRKFVARIPKHGILIYCNDSVDVVDIAKSAQCRTVSYGTLDGSHYRVKNYVPLPEDAKFRQRFSLEGGDASRRFSETVSLQLAGIHNALNVTAIIALLDFLKKDRERVISVVAQFSGVERRFEYIGEHFGTLVYDDFAHHPEEIRATLKAFRELFPTKNIRVIFHPHTFTRTKALFEEFSQCFTDANQVSLLDIYGSAREVQGGVSSEELVREINRFTHGKAEYIVDVSQFLETLIREMGRNDVIITMGAGDVWKLGKKLLP